MLWIPCCNGKTTYTIPAIRFSVRRNCCENHLRGSAPPSSLDFPDLVENALRAAQAAKVPSFVDRMRAIAAAIFGKKLIWATPAIAAAALLWAIWPASGPSAPAIPES